jgi:hypothetical protein
LTGSSIGALHPENNRKNKITPNICKSFISPAFFYGHNTQILKQQAIKKTKEWLVDDFCDMDSDAIFGVFKILEVFIMYAQQYRRLLRYLFV